MNKIVLFLFLSIIFIGCRKTQSIEIQFCKVPNIQDLKYNEQNADIHYVIDLLFSSSEVKINSDFSFVWTPNYEESLNFNVSFDNKCHTRLDTVLNFSNNLMKDYSIYIFKTQAYNDSDSIISCHFCPANISVAVFKNTLDTLELVSFQKHFTDSGLFGGEGKEGIGRFSIIKIENEVFLSLKRPISGNNGYNSGIEDLYFIDGTISCERLYLSFSYEYYQEKNNKIIEQSLNLKESTNKSILINTDSGIKKEFSFDKKHCKFIH